MNVSDERLRELAALESLYGDGVYVSQRELRAIATTCRAVLAVRELLDNARPTQFAFTEAELRAIVGADAREGGDG